MIDTSKIKLFHVYKKSAGHEIHAHFNQTFNCVEFTMNNAPQPITWTHSDVSPPQYLFSEKWIQFAPKEWQELINAVFSEIVDLWNNKERTSSLESENAKTKELLVSAIEQCKAHQEDANRVYEKLNECAQIATAEKRARLKVEAKLSELREAAARYLECNRKYANGIEFLEAESALRALLSGQAQDS